MSKKIKNPYKTHWYHRQASHWFQKTKKQLEGHLEKPECIYLDAVEEGDENNKPPVRIYLGTEPGQYRATRVFVWSVMQVRNPKRAYEIYLMSDLKGIKREEWKTGFTNYRYAIPHLAGLSGRAIYNDVDQIYLSDPALLFDHEMKGKGVLAITEKENSVMLIDCDLMAPLWTIDDVNASKRHEHFKGVMSDNNLYGELAGTWNNRDGEYKIVETDCLHYTTLHTQPWRPFPDRLKYSDSKLGKVWHDLEEQADDARYFLFTRQKPSLQSQDLVHQYEKMHEAGKEVQIKNPQDPEPFAGGSLFKHIERIKKQLARNKCKTVLDYGAGKGGAYEKIDGEPSDSPMRKLANWPDVTVQCYDPGYAPFATLPDETFDGVISTDVVEHIPPFDVAWILDEIFSRAGKSVYIVAACYPARKILPNGQNAHAIIENPYWWHSQVALIAKHFPEIDWLLVCEEKGRFGKKRTLFDKSSPSPLR